MMIKLSDETIKALGAANAGDAQSKIDELLKISAKAKADADNIASAIATSGEQMKAIVARLDAVEKREFKLSEADRTAIIEAAKTEASTVAKTEGASAVSAAIAKVGVGAVGAGTKADDNANPVKVDESNEDGEAVWNANSKNLLAEGFTK